MDLHFENFKLKGLCLIFPNGERLSLYPIRELYPMFMANIKYYEGGYKASVKQ